MGNGQRTTDNEQRATGNLDTGAGGGAVSAYVELEEGVRMLTNIVGCKPEELRIGMAVEVAFDDVTPQTTLVKFRPAS